MLSIYSIVKYGIIMLSCKMYACCMYLCFQMLLIQNAFPLRLEFFWNLTLNIVFKLFNKSKNSDRKLKSLKWF